MGKESNNEKTTDPYKTSRRVDMWQKFNSEQSMAPYRMGGVKFDEMWKRFNSEKKLNSEKSMDPYSTSRGVKFAEGLNDRKKTVTITRPANAAEWGTMYNNRVAAQATRHEGKKLKKQIGLVEEAAMYPENWEQLDDVEGPIGPIDIQSLSHITPYESRELAQQAVPDGSQLLAQLNAMNAKSGYDKIPPEDKPWGGKKTKRRKSKSRRSTRRKTKSRRTKHRKN